MSAELKSFVEALDRELRQLAPSYRNVNTRDAIRAVRLALGEIYRRAQNGEPM